MIFGNNQIMKVDGGYNLGLTETLISVPAQNSGIYTLRSANISTID